MTMRNQCRHRVLQLLKPMLIAALQLPGDRRFNQWTGLLPLAEMAARV